MKLRKRKEAPTHIAIAKVMHKPLNAAKKEKVVKPTKKSSKKQKKERQNTKRKFSNKKNNDSPSHKSASESEENEQEDNKSITESSFTLSDIENESNSKLDSDSDSEFSFKKKSAKKKIKKQKILTKKKKTMPIPTKMGYTEEQMAKYKELKNEYYTKSIKELKSLLRLNQQSMTGTKDELVSKVADGEIKGAIPKCAKCGGGYLKYDYKTDIYSCKGFMDDSSWHFCRFMGNGDEVHRFPWVLSPEFSHTS